MSDKLEGAGASPNNTLRAQGDLAIAAQPADLGPDVGSAEMVQAEPVLAVPLDTSAHGGLPLAVWAGALAVLVLLLLAWLLRG